jgi:Transglutaminase-like superfamily
MARFRSIRRLLLRFGQVSNLRRALLAEAVFCLFAARLALIFVSFPKLARHFGAMVLPTDPRMTNAGRPGHSNQIWIAKEISWAVTSAARYVPFRAVCLPQAMAAHSMLKRRGVASVMHFGAGKGEAKPLDTHTWLDAAGVEVTGYPVEERLAEIVCFM